MSEKRYKLHPVAAIINFLKGLKELILPFIILIVANGLNFSFNPLEEGFWSNIFPLAILSLISIVYLFSGVIKWWTFVYWFEEDELRVEYGLFIKKKRYIPFDRIQSFNYKEGIFHRIFGLVQVMVETAGSTNGKPEVVLTAITKEAANDIEDITRKVKQETEHLEINESTVLEETAVQNAKVIHKMNTKDLIILATTSNSIGVVLAGIVALLSQLGDLIPYEKLFEEVSSLIKFGFVIIALSVIGALLLTWLVSVLITFVNYYDFTVVEENDRLIITRGLLEKKKVTIPLNRIQAIKIVENPLRQWFGFAAVAVESASGGFGDKDQKVILFPLISKKDLFHPLQNLFPHLEWEQTLTKPPKKAKPFFYRIDFLWLVPLVAICTYFWYPYGLLSVLIIIPAIMIGLWQYRTTGYAMNGQQLTIVYRMLSRVTFVVEKKRIQALESKQSYFQKRRSIATFQATVMSGMMGATARARNLELEDVEAVMEWFEK
ncbi:PH domain-containing protein [Lysinibacillus halotolerans]